MADTYAESVRAGANMRSVVEALEPVRAALSGDVQPLRAWSLIDDQIGRAGGPPFQPVLLTLREHFMAAFQKTLVADLGSMFATDPGRGWTQWLDLYARALGEWRVHFCEILARLPLDFPAHEPSIGQIRDWSRLASHERWPEIYDWASWLATSSISTEARARMHLLAGKIQLHRYERLQKARVHFEQAESLQPEDPEVKGAWGQYWRTRGDGAKARELFLAEIGAGPHLDDGYTNMGNLLGDGEEADLTGAERYMQLATTNCPGSIFGYVSFLEFLAEPTLFPYRQHQIADLRRRITVLDPSYPEIDRLREADALGGNQRESEARAIYLALLEQEPDRLRTLIALGDSYVREWAAISKGKPEEAAALAEARAWYEKAIACAPTAIDGYWRLADLLKGDGQAEPALELCRRMLGLHPDWEPRVRVRMGELLLDLDRMDEARAEFERAHALEPRLVNAQAPVQRLGDAILERSRDADKAIPLYELVRDREIQSSEGSYQNRVGNALYYVDRDAEAAEAYRLAVAAAGDEPVYHANLAGALEHMTTEGARASELSEAIAALDRAIALAPTRAEFVARRARLVDQRNFIELYGEKAPKPGSLPIRLQVHDGTLPRLLNEEQSELSEETLKGTDEMRTRVSERTGLVVPGIMYGWLNEPERPEGTWRLIIREGVATVEGEMAGWGDQSLHELVEQVEPAIEDNIWALVTHDSVAGLLEKSSDVQFGVVRKDLRLLNRLVALSRQHARSTRGLHGLGTLVSAVMSQTPASASPGSGEVPAEASTPADSPAPRPVFRVGAAAEWWYQLQLDAVQTSLFEETGVIIPVPAVVVDPGLTAEGAPVVEIGGEPVEVPAGENVTPHAILRPHIARFVSTRLVLHYLASLSAQSPVLLDTAMELLGLGRIQQDLVARLRDGKNIRNFEGILEELLLDEVLAVEPA